MLIMISAGFAHCGSENQLMMGNPSLAMITLTAPYCGCSSQVQTMLVATSGKMLGK